MQDWGWKCVALPCVAWLFVQSNWSRAQQPTSSVPPGQSSLPSHLLQGSIHLVSVLRFGMSVYIFGQAMPSRGQTILEKTFSIHLDR